LRERNSPLEAPPEPPFCLHAKKTGASNLREFALPASGIPLSHGRGALHACPTQREALSLQSAACGPHLLPSMPSSSIARGVNSTKKRDLPIHVITTPLQLTTTIGSHLKVNVEARALGVGEALERLAPQIVLRQPQDLRSRHS